MFMAKRLHQHILKPRGGQQADTYEPISSGLASDMSILKGGRVFRSRDRISRFLDHSAFGVALDIFLALMSVVFVATYIWNTYIPKNTLPPMLWATDIICAGCFMVDYVFRGVYLAEHRRDYIFSIAGIINLLVIVPVIPMSFFLEYHTFWYDDTHWRFLYPLRFIKCYLEMKAVLSRCHSLVTPVRQFAILCYIQIVLIISFAAGIIQIAETSDGVHNATNMGDWTFFNSFFNSVLVFVTIQTPPADNVLSKVFVGVLVIVLILIVPYQISKVLDLGKSYSDYEIARFKPSSRSKHIILCGDLTASRIDHFFSEVFHDDHDALDINVVIMFEEEPSTSLVSLLMDPFFEKRTSFIQGSLLDVDDANRAAVDSADGIFILARRCGEEDYLTSDHRTLMRVMAARRMAPHARIFAQMHLSSNRHLMEDLGVKNVLYFSEVMNSLLGQNCICPGFSTFIYNLTSTSSDDSGLAAPPEDGNACWEERYIHGSSHELYSVSLPPPSEVFGRTFAEVASLVYAECAGVILFAVLSHSMGLQGKILLNPGHAYSCMGDETVFVIAKDRREAELVTRMRLAKKPASAWSSHRSGSLQKSLDLDSKPLKAHERRKSKLMDWTTKTDKPEDPKKQRSTVESATVESIDDLTLSLPPIVVCVAAATTFPHNAEFLVGPLRVKALLRHRPIIFVTATLPSSDNYDTFRHFKNVYFIQGDPFRIPTLKRAGIEKAHKIVIMGGGGEIAESSSFELLSDASSVALHKTITCLVGPTRAPRVITELANRANVHFVAQNLVASDWFRDNQMMPMSSRQLLAQMSSTSFSKEFHMSPAFASGLTYSTSLCDSLMINHYFNPMVKSILWEFIFASWKDVDYVTAPLSPPNGACDPTMHSPASSIMSPTSAQRSSLFAVEVPVDFVGKTFEYVFHYLLSSDGIVTVGLYRCRPDWSLMHGNTKNRIEQPDDQRGIPFGYVYVNPFPTDILSGNDLLYVLSHRQPCWA
ncbi:TPA: hypothetical protein N0F65_006914 [Lagenidium giganteum]|uniref:Calcium-activated potassium channel BK alpha subunit domain-containing protein n=1 Tax=Lagenidium giganteum TaxID=4803 RepID=A0AAV2ZE20_9STRA|nr:TPA: hypothetical protein N0F65_006914 [Lagenidium giganteum]